jgi:hypothetical protein
MSPIKQRKKTIKVQAVEVRGRGNNIVFIILSDVMINKLSLYTIFLKAFPLT